VAFRRRSGRGAGPINGRARPVNHRRFTRSYQRLRGPRREEVAALAVSVVKTLFLGKI
jgi:hypothetical protein